MSAIDVEQDAGSGLRSEQGVAPVSQQTPTDGGEAIFGAAFRQTNTVVSAIQAMRNSGNFAPVPGYNPVDDIKAWKEPNYFLEHGDNFVGSQSPAETQSIKAQIDTETTDRRTLAANGKIGFVASTVAGITDPTMLLPGGVAIDATKGGLSFTKAAVQLGKAGLMQTVAQEALLHASQETRTAEESALNIASGTLLTALIGGGAASLLRPAERVALERALHADRAEINTHAENPSTGEARPVSVPDENANPEIISKAATDFQEMGPGSNRSVDRERAIQQQLGDAAAQQYRSEFDRLTNEAVAARMAERTSGTGVAAAAGAAASDTRQVELVNFGLNQVPGLRTVVEKTSPMQRLFGAAGVTVRRTIADLAETSLLTKENLEGKVTTAGPAVDRQARLMINQGQVAVGDELTKLFSEYRYGEQRALVRQRSTIEDMTGRAEPGKMSFDDFKQAVTEAARNGDTHDIPQVQMAAQTIRNKVFEPWKKRAIEAGLLGENVDVKTADSYVQRLYNKQAIAAKRPEFVNRVADWLAADQSAKAEAQTRIEGLSKRISDAETNIEFFTKQLAKTGEDDLLRPGHEQDLSRAIENHRTARRQLETEIASWEGKSVSEAKAALKVREEAEQARAEKQSAGAYKGKGERLSSADKAIDKAVKRILKSDRDLSRQELESRAQEITDRIIGSPDGRLPYDLGMEHGAGGAADDARGPLAAREFNIPDKTIADFLENDIEHIVATHLRTMVPDVLLTEKFGDVQMTEAFRKINDEYAALSSAAKSEKERTALEKERQGAISDLASVRDRIRGIYGIAPDGPLRNAARAVGVLKNYNVLTSMGSAALSSLPDMAGSVMRHGLTATFNDAWRPFFSMLTQQSDVWKEAGRQYRAMGIAVESVLASRHHALTDTLDTYHPQSRVERTMQWATNRFQFVNMLAPWTDFAKINASMVAGSEILRAVKASTEGKLSARQLRNLGESGIEPHMAERIAKAFETGGEIRDGVHLPNTADWADAEARRVFEGAVARDADIAVVTPGQEKPLWMSHQILSVLGQFKSFTAAATERVLISNLQRRDAQVLQGMIFSMGLGMLSYKINSLTGGQPTSEKPQDWIKESISRGNLLGWFEEANALSSKVTRGGVDVYRLIGADKPLSRYASRSAMDQILGPTAGKIGGILSVGSAISKPSEWNESDSKALRRLVASQNVFYIRRLFDQVEASGNNAFGIPMKAKPENR